MPSIAQLQYVLAVHQTGHFGRAAALAGVSQPTLSTQIQKVESELGLTIFDRLAKPVAPTERGRAVIEQARAVVSAHDNLLRMAAGDLSEVASNFALGIIPTLAPYVLPWFLSSFVEAYPKVELAIFERPTDEIIAEIGQGRLDAAILATPLGEGNLVEEVLFYDPFYLYSNPRELPDSGESVEVADLESSKMWLLEDGHCVRTQVVNFCGFQDRTHMGSVRFAAGSFETIRHLIDSSEGYTLIPESYARTLPKSIRQSSVRAFENRTPTREVSLVHHRRSAKKDLVEAVFSVVLASIPRALKQVAADGEILPVVK